jgi:serine/threonine protein phosphatase 1
MSGRVIAIGDIHGCHHEFADLLARLAPTRDDRLVLLGDLVNRGPDSARVIELAQEHGALALLGNHELRLLTARRTGETARLKEDDRATMARLGAAHWEYLAAMPLTHEIAELGLVFVHGGFLPGQPSSIARAGPRNVAMRRRLRSGPTCGPGRHLSCMATRRGRKSTG